MNPEEQVVEALGDQEAMAFLRSHFLNHYGRIAPELETTPLVNKLLEAFRGPFEEAVQIHERALEVHRTVFSSGQGLFSRAYGIHKRDVKNPAIADFCQARMVGESIMDVGCGPGDLGVDLARRGYQVQLTDVLDYRKPEALHLPFTTMPNAETIPGDESVSNLSFIQVLHHAPADAHVGLLKQAANRAERVLILEDVYGDDLNEVDPSPSVEDLESTRSFLALPQVSQRAVLLAYDYLVNGAVKGLPHMAMPFTFRTVADWKTQFDQAGLHLKETVRLGFWKALGHPIMNVGFVLEP